MRTVQVGDTVRVRYVKRSQDGAAAVARSRTPVEIVVGTDHPRLPGLGIALAGLAPGETTTVHVPAGQGHGPADPARIHRWARARFPKDQPLAAGQWVSFTNSRGRRHLVRVVAVGARMVVVDTNSRWAGRALELEVELLGILATAPGSDAPPV